MKHKKMKVSAVLLLGLGLTSVQAQTMYVKESSGTQTAHDITNIQTMTFSGGNASIQKTDNSTASFALSEISYINFEYLLTNIEEPAGLENLTRLTAYPNPVSDILSIDLSSLKNKQGILTVLALDGSTVLTQPTQGTANEMVNLSSLTAGVYYCQFANGNEIKTVKIIKQ